MSSEYRKGKVYIQGIPAGIIMETDAGYSFKYDKEYLQRDKVHVLQFSDNRLFRPVAVRWTVYLVLFAAVFYYSFNNVSQEFIYFQF